MGEFLGKIGNHLGRLACFLCFSFHFSSSASVLVAKRLLVVSCGSIAMIPFVFNTLICFGLVKFLER